MAVVSVAAMGMTACQNSPQMDEKPAAGNASSEVKIAYVEVDSIMTQYNFCKDYQKILEKRGTNIQNALAAQEQNLQAAAQNFQNKVNNNGFSSRQEAESQQAAIQRQQEQYLASRDRLANELQSETAKFNEALHDSLEHFIAKYIKDKKPALCFIHIDALDHMGHAYGKGSAEYYAELPLVDDRVRRIVEGVKEAGIYDDSIIILTSDHGHEGTGHGGQTMNEMETPLVIWGKGIRKNHEIAETVIQYDLAATVAEVFHLEKPQSWRGVCIPVFE